MANVQTQKRRPRFPGMHIFHDPRNENHLIARSAFMIRTADEPFKPVTSSLRAYWLNNDQGMTPMCGAFGGLTGRCSAPYGWTRPPIRPTDFYQAIRDEDKRNGRVYDEGVTSVAVAMTMMKLSMIKSFSWGYTLDTALRVLANPDKSKRQVLFFGTLWYNSMFNADKDGVIRVVPSSGDAGGHFYCVGAYNAKTQKATIRQTWGKDEFGHQDQLIDATDLLNLIRNDGEFFMIEETPK